MVWVTEACIITPRPTDRSSGYLRSRDLTGDTFAGLSWAPSTPARERRVVVDLRFCTAFEGGVADRLGRVLAEAGAGRVDVESGCRANVRIAFATTLAQACAQYERELRR